MRDLARAYEITLSLSLFCTANSQVRILPFSFKVRCSYRPTREKFSDMIVQACRIALTITQPIPGIAMLQFYYSQ